MSFYRFDISPDSSNNSLPIHFRSTEVPNSQARFSIEVQENGDGRLDEEDRYVLTRQSRSQVLEPREGLRVLNYYLHPENLRHNHLQMDISRRESSSVSAGSRPVSLGQSGIFSPIELSAIEHSHSAWFMDGHLDTSLLVGARTFTQDEVNAWTARPAHFPYGRFLASEGGAHLIDSGFVLGDWNRWVGGDVSWSDMRIGQVAEKVIIGFTFGALSSAVGSNLVWHLFSGNYTSNELGRIFANRHAVNEIRDLTHERGSSSINFQQNVRVVDIQNQRAQRNLYFGFTEPIIALACAADRDFWRWLFQVPRLTHFGEYSMLGAYARNARETVTALAAEASASGAGFRALASGAVVAGSSFLSFYELTQIWYESYGHLDYGSRENKITSFISTFFTQTWFLSRVAQQVRDAIASLPNSSAASTSLSLVNIARARVPLNNWNDWSRVNFQVIDLLRDFSRNFPLANLLTRRVIDPSLGELARNIQKAAQDLEEIASRRDLITAIQSGERSRSLFQNFLFRFNPNLYQGYMLREVDSTGRALLQAQRSLLSAAEMAERHSSRIGNAASSLNQALQALRSLVQSTGPVVQTAHVNGVAGSAGAVLAETVEGVERVIQTGGFPQVVEEVEVVVEQGAANLARQALGVARAGATTLRAGATPVVAELEAMAPQVEAGVAQAGGVLRNNREAVVGGGGALVAGASQARAAVSVARNTMTAMQLCARALSSARLVATGISGAAGVKVGLMLAGSFAVGAGIGTGIAYATGIYDEHYTPRDALRDFKEWIFE